MGLSTGAIIALTAAGTATAGAGVQAYGAYEQGNAAKKAADYNATIAEQNSHIATQDATWQGQEGEAQAGIQGLKNRAVEGSIKANQAAGGIDVNKGSAVDVRASQEQLGQFDAMTIRSNAARKAYGFETQSTSDIAQSNLDRAEGANAQTAGEIGAAGTLLSGSSSAASKYAEFMSANNPTAPGDTV